MTTLVRADEKGRLCIRGTKKGQEYLVRAEKEGWWITPVEAVQRPQQTRQWIGSEKTLIEHLQGLAASGLRVGQSSDATRKVRKCRF
jgi:hypothetical protein